MAVIRLGLPEIERQLRSVRRRRNVVTVQQALYLWGGLGALASALVTLAALRTEATAFDFVFWAALAALGLGLAAAVHHLWSRWLSASAAVHWIDRSGELDDRLATVAAYQAHPQPTRLASLVVNQLFTLRHRWQPKVLVPRRVPHSVYFFLASLIALLATGFIERPPAEPRAFRISPIGNSIAPGKSVATGPGSLADAAHLGGAPGEAAAGGRPSGERQAAKSHGAVRAARQGIATHRAEGIATGETVGDGQAANGLTDGDRTSRDRSARDTVSRRVQEMIRQALGAKSEPPRATFDRPPAGEQTAATRRDLRQRRGPSEDETGRSASASASAGTMLDRSGQERAERQASSRKDGEAEGLPGGQRASGGAGGKRGSGSLFASDASRAHDRGAFQTFPLNLSALAQAARNALEPQRRRGDGVPGIGSAVTLPSEPEIRARDQADDPLLRTDVPPEYEGIVRRIFSRPE